MKNLARETDTGPRRLKFAKPEPKIDHGQLQKAAARDKRAAKPETFVGPPRDRSRLPDGARFDVIFDAADVRWNGTLTVGDIVVEGSCGTVLTLLCVLDQKYRAKAGRQAEIA